MLLKNEFYKSCIATTESGEEFTYEFAAKFSNNIGRYLKSRSLIFCLVKNNIESLFGYVALIENKIVTVLLDSEISESNLQKLIHLYSPNYIWLEKKTFSIFFSDNKVLFSFNNYVLINYSYVKVHVNSDLALLLTTSGSTGNPKQLG